MIISEPNRQLPFWYNDTKGDASILSFWELGQENQEESIQRITEKTCEISHKKVFPSRGSRNPNYWWNEEIARLRGETLKKRRLAQRARLRNEEYAEQMGSSYKKSRKELRLAIFRSKRLAWKEFTATLDWDPWGLLYKRIIAIFSTRRGKCDYAYPVMDY